MIHNDFVTYDPATLTITVNFPNKPPLVIGSHDPNLRLSHFSHGHGGQNVNKHMSGVQLIYSIPPAYRHITLRTQEVTVRCHEQRHQHANMIGAFKHLAEKLHDYFYVPPARISTKLPYRAKIGRLNAKRHQSFKKKNRQSPEE